MTKLIIKDVTHNIYLKDYEFKRYKDAERVALALNRNDGNYYMVTERYWKDGTDKLEEVQ